MVREREQVAHVEMLRKLGLFCLTGWELSGYCIAACNYLMGSYKRMEQNSAEAKVIARSNSTNLA